MMTTRLFYERPEAELLEVMTEKIIAGSFLFNDPEEDDILEFN